MVFLVMSLEVGIEVGIGPVPEGINSLHIGSIRYRT